MSLGGDNVTEIKAFVYDPTRTPKENRRALQKFMGYDNVEHYVHRNMAIMRNIQYKKFMRAARMIWLPRTVDRAIDRLRKKGLLKKYFEVDENNNKVWYLRFLGPIYDNSMEPKR